MNLLTELKSIPKDLNCEIISCRCGAETIVLQKDYVIRYTCPTCWSKLKKRQASVV